jgi:hypothetical protein
MRIKHRHLQIRTTGSDWPSLRCFLFPFKSKLSKDAILQQPARIQAVTGLVRSTSVRQVALQRAAMQVGQEAVGTLKLKQQPEQRHPHNSISNPSALPLPNHTQASTLNRWNNYRKKNKNRWNKTRSRHLQGADQQDRAVAASAEQVSSNGSRSDLLPPSPALPPGGLPPMPPLIPRAAEEARQGRPGPAAGAVRQRAVHGGRGHCAGVRGDEQEEEQLRDHDADDVAAEAGAGRAYRR